MRRVLLVIVLVLGSVVGAVVPIARSAESAAPDCVVTVAGDIASSAYPNDDDYINALRTGDVVRAVNPTYALTAGDNAYPDGTLEDFRTKYDPTWGTFKSVTRPSPGNHEYRVSNAQGYFDYFFAGGRTANEYYAFDCGAWRLYSLNCEIDCGAGSAQLAWLQDDLAAHPGRHYLGYLHQPRFTSASTHSPNQRVADLWAAIQSAGGDVMLSAHSHNYERFAKQDASGAADPTGMRQFVVGSGGANLVGFGGPLPNSQFRDAEHFGVLKLVLSTASYAWQFISAGRRDVSGTGVDDPEHPLGTVLDQGDESTNLGGSSNRPPVVAAGADQTVTLPEGASLSGTVADDGLPDGTLSTTWTQVSGPGAAVFADASAPSTSVSFPVEGSYLLRLTGSDGALSSSDDVAVEVRPEGSPPPVTVLDVRVGGGSDDAEEAAGGGVYLNSSDLELVTDGTNVQRVGIRFSGLAVPAGATITEAWLQFQVDEVSTAAASLTVQGVAQDNTSTFVNSSRNISLRPLTAATVGWSPAPWPTVGARGPDQRTPSLAAVLQEVIDRPGWASGNALALVLRGSGRRTAEAFESGPAPVLHVAFTHD